MNVENEKNLWKLERKRTEKQTKKEEIGKKDKVECREWEQIIELRRRKRKEEEKSEREEEEEEVGNKKRGEYREWEQERKKKDDDEMRNKIKKGEC